MSFFKQFPTVGYDLFEENQIKTITHIFRHVDVNDIGIDPQLAYTYYDIDGADRPDNVSLKLYGTTDFYWTFFIVNDELKNGLKEWPMSDRTFEKYITQEFDKYSVLRFTPANATQAAIVTDKGKTISQYDVLRGSWTGLDMDHPYLRISRFTDFVTRKPIAYAKVAYYDTNTYQLYVSGVTNPSKFFRPEDGSQADEFYNYDLDVYNPYSSGSAEYVEAERLNTAWRKSVYEYMEEFDPAYHFYVYRYFLTDTIGHNQFDVDENGQKIVGRSRSNGGLIPGTAEETAYYKDYINAWHSYSASNAQSTIRLGRNAVAQYLASDGVTPITAYEAFKSFSIIDVLTGAVDYPYFNTVIEQERSKNLAKRQIRVIKPNAIQAFVDAYKNLIEA